MRHLILFFAIVVRNLIRAVAFAITLQRLQELLSVLIWLFIQLIFIIKINIFELVFWYLLVGHFCEQRVDPDGGL